MTEPERGTLDCIDLNVSIGSVQVTQGLQLSLRAGEVWCVLGPNGSGKTLLLHTLAGLRPAQRGTVLLNGSPLDSMTRRAIARQLGILFQHQLDSFPATVLEQVLQGRHPHLHAWQWENASDQRIAHEAIDTLGLGGLTGRNVQTLSGGERQRTAIAALLAQQANVMLLDEPTNHLDLRHRQSLLGRIANTARQTGQTLVISLHDINLAARIADHALLLFGNGRTRHGTCVDVLNRETLEALYQQPLEEVTTASGPAWLPR